MKTESPVIAKSRTRLKKEALELKDLGKRLVALPPETLDKIEFSQELKEEIRFARTLKKHGAIKRQIQFIASLLRKIDPEPILNGLDHALHDKSKFTQVHRQVEKIRDELVAGDEELLLSLPERFPRMDSNELNKLVSQSIKDGQRGDAKKSYRKLFRYLRSMFDSGD
jgi:ribosome-associated protein